MDSASRANFAQTIDRIDTLGGVTPVNVSAKTANSRLFEFAAPGLSMTTTQKQPSDAAMAACASYQGYSGLRKLQGDRTSSQIGAGCGWVETPTGGRGVLGTSSGPARAEDKQNKYYWDLKEAERNVVQNEVNRLGNKATLMARAPEHFGFCEDSQKIIPIDRTPTGIQVRSGFANNPLYACKSSSITAPAPVGNREGFVDGAGDPMTISNYMSKCTTPLNRDCVIQAARLAGCTDEGTLLQALNPSNNNPYQILAKTPSFQAYQDKSLFPNVKGYRSVTNSMLTDGSVADINVALDDFQALANSMSSVESMRMRMASRDLCLKSGEYDVVSFCGDLAPTTRITEKNLVCIQNEFRNNGGTAQGKAFPDVKNWLGRNYGEFQTMIRNILERIQSNDKKTNAQGIEELMGIDTKGPFITGDMPRSDDTRGAETIWISLGDGQTNGQTPTIHRCDLQMASRGEPIPMFMDRDQLATKYNVPADMIAFMNAFEFRPDTDGYLRFAVATDDGYMLSKNQFAFEGTNQNDWGSWRHQGPNFDRPYIGPGAGYPVAGIGKGVKERNIITTKWFQGGGGAAFRMQIAAGGQWLNPWDGFQGRKDIYLTQEPLAPWLQYEIVNKRNTRRRDITNTGVTTSNETAFLEKRWNGSVATQISGQVEVCSFDADWSGPVDFQKKQTESFMRLSGTRASWFTRARFAFTAFRTITLLCKLSTNGLSPAGNAFFHHVNPIQKFGFSVNVKQSNTGQYNLELSMTCPTGQTMVETTPMPMQEWCMVVLQYHGDLNTKGQIQTCRYASIHATTLDSLRTKQGISSFTQNLLSKQNMVKQLPTSFNNTTANLTHAGHLVLGSLCAKLPCAPGVASLESVQGDIRWLHGFRNYLDTTTLVEAETFQFWKTRWVVNI